MCSIKVSDAKQIYLLKDVGKLNHMNKMLCNYVIKQTKDEERVYLGK